MDYVLFTDEQVGDIKNVVSQANISFVSEEEVNKGYVFSDKDIPQIEFYVGKVAKLKLNIVTHKLFYEYEDRVLSPEEQQIRQIEQDLGNVLFESAADKARIAELETAQGDLLMEIATLKMGGSL
ncbi:hypothetical protein HMPREF1013_00823 [Bacillus sp. 2_A_57_CT2]|nr:hypothetical protein HMPREF1013_00823 [Bacillus sp. 2_A_57_CT2]